MRIKRAAVCVLLAFGALRQPVAFGQEMATESPVRLEARSLVRFNQYLYYGAFGRPRALACDREKDEIWMADSISGRIGVFRADGSEVYSFRSRQLVRDPLRIAIAPGGDLYVIEADRTKVRHFNYRGDFVGDVSLPEADYKRAIAAIAFDRAGNLYVGDNATAEVVVLTPEGRVKLQFGSRGRDEGQFMAFAAIAVASDGSILVADQQAIGVQRFDAQGNFVAGWGKHEMGKGNFSLPSGLAVDKNDRIYVSDELRHEVDVFNIHGGLLAVFGGLGEGPGQLAFPTDVAVDGDGRIYVAERSNARVQVFELVEK